jgi:LysM repeat protein
MHYDQKVGLALGILLVGVAGAFFFRHDQKPNAALSALDRTSAIDAAIIEKPLTPYLPGTNQRTAKTNTAQSTKQSDGHRIGSLRAVETNPGGIAAAAPSSLSKGPGTDSNQAQSGDTVPYPLDPPIDHFLPAESTAIARNDETVPAIEANQPKPAAADTFHVVERGDTLSSIAARYLGRESRFYELFDANRDQLQRANDLKPGMKLRIPDANGGVITHRPQVAKREVDTSQPKRFVPPGRKQSAPDEAGQPAAQQPEAAPGDPKKWSGKRLSQLPPQVQ